MIVWPAPHVYGHLSGSTANDVYKAHIYIPLSLQSLLSGLLGPRSP